MGDEVGVGVDVTVGTGVFVGIEISSGVASVVTSFVVCSDETCLEALLLELSEDEEQPTMETIRIEISKDTDRI